MADAEPLFPPASQKGTARPTHPLKAWRQTQRVAERGGSRTMKVADASRAFGIPFQTWAGWEKYPDEAGHRKPGDAYLKKLFLFTDGALRPDHFHQVNEWRAELRAIREAAQDAA